MPQTFAPTAGTKRSTIPLLLPPQLAADCLNQRPGRGDMRPWNGPQNVATVPAGRASIYRMGRDAPSDATFWLSWPTDVDVVRSMIADDTVERTYWTDGVAPKWTDNSFGLAAPPYPSLFRLLGIPAPTTAPTTAIQVAGAGQAESRFYVWTWVTDRGEESAPSPPSAGFNVNGGSTVRVTFNDTIPSQRGVNRKRLYRTQADSNGGADFFFVAEVAAATTQFDDSTTLLAEPLPSLTWVTPPDTMRGLIELWNGIFAGFVGKAIRFCVPYRPFAWPIQYELTVPDTIVALAKWGENLLVLTTGQPYIINGSDPAAMSLVPMQINQACVAKRGVVSFGHGVVWPSPDGLVYSGATGTKIITGELFLREDWQALQPSTFIASEFEGAYIASYNPGGGRVSLILDPVQPQGFYPLSIGFDATFRDPITDSLYLLSGTNVQKFNTGSLLTLTLRSRTVRETKPINYPWAQVVASAYPVTLSIVADNVTRVNARVVNSDAPFRLPGGFKATEWRIELSSTNPVTAVHLAESTEVLQQLP